MDRFVVLVWRLDPDLATFATGEKSIFNYYGALRWAGAVRRGITPPGYEIAYSFTPDFHAAVLSVHSIVSFDSRGQVHGWHATIFTPYSWRARFRGLRDGFDSVYPLRNW